MYPDGVVSVLAIIVPMCNGLKAWWRTSGISRRGCGRLVRTDRAVGGVFRSHLERYLGLKELSETCQELDTAQIDDRFINATVAVVGSP